MRTEESAWRVCNTCKTPIAFEQTYYVCSVSTCNRKRTGFFFCSIACWDTHLPIMRHREAWAEEIRAPTQAAWERAQKAEREKTAVRARPTPSAPLPGSAPGHDQADTLPKDVLVVVSKLKQYIKQHANMNTSDNVTGVLSDHLRDLCNQAIDNATQDGRRTVMDRDFLHDG